MERRPEENLPVRPGPPPPGIPWFLERLPLGSSTGGKRRNVAALAAALDPGDLVPLDGAVVHDTLANGLVVYGRENPERREPAELRLVIRAGSVLDSDEERGLAHFVEHMAFNGTERFEKQAIVDYPLAPEQTSR